MWSLTFRVLRLCLYTHSDAAEFRSPLTYHAQIPTEPAILRVFLIHCLYNFISFFITE